MASVVRTYKLSQRAVSSFFMRKPLGVSFEVTRNCNAFCKHCHLGGRMEEEERATPEELARRNRELRPVVTMVSGGEPLLRKDLIAILKAIKKQGKATHMVLTTHGALLNRKKYESIRDAGVDLISLSFDYPDERHDEFRGIPGLFNKIIGFLEDIQDVEDKGIAFSTVVQRDNYRDLPKIAELAKKYGIQMNMSTYTWLRTQKKEYMIPPAELPELKTIIQQLREFKKKHNTIIASEFGFRRMIEFFEKGSVGHCRAGRRFLIINPDATLSPCGLIMGNYRSRKELIEDFSKQNDCGYCATSIRVNSEKTFPYYLVDVIKFLYGAFFPKRQKAH